MKIKSCVFLAAATFATLAVAFDETSDFKTQIRKEMARYVTSIKKKDLVMLEKIIKADFAPEFKETDRQGRVRNREQTIAAMKLNVGVLKSVQSASLKIESAKVAGNKATTKEHFLMSATMPSMEEVKKTAKLTVDSQWTATYAKKNGKWLCVSAKTFKEKVTIDGKSMN